MAKDYDSEEQAEARSKRICIAIIAVSVLIGGGVFFMDMKKTAKETKIVSELEKSPAGQIITSFKEVGKSAKKIEDFDTLNKNLADAAKMKAQKKAEKDVEAEKPEYYEATFVRAKDGDTYVIKAENSDEDITVRLIGVDTPESVAPSSYSKENTEEGKEVSDIVKSKLHEGDTVFLEFDASTEDKYGRMLAYVYLEDGTMMQDWLLENGYARTATYPPNVKYADHFSEIQHKAVENNAGFWNGFFENEGE